jgi:hypothetical protein
MSSPLENESSLSSSTKVLGDMTGLGWPATSARWAYGPTRCTHMSSRIRVTAV